VIARDPHDAAGWEVLDLGLACAKRSFGPALEAAYALGSLAHGGFVAEVSDVDLALIVARMDAGTPAQMAAVQAEVRGRVPTPLAARLSLFWSTWKELGSAGRFPLLDVVDLERHGVLLHGEDRRDVLEIPGGEALESTLVLESAEFFLQKLATADHDALLHEPARLVAKGRREVTKAVLFPVRFLYTVDGGRACDNAAATTHYVETRSGPARALVGAAARWRAEGWDDPRSVEALLEAELLPLYIELTTAYEAALLGRGQAGPANAIARWRERLTSPPLPS
jgi:hypothetical protein